MYLPASVSVATILCGTNNMDNNVYQPHDIVDSVIACGTKLRGKHPHLKVIVAGILSRDGAISKIRNKIQQTNDILKKVCWNKLGFSYIEQASQWPTSSGELNQRLFWKDKIHLNRKGCNLLAEQINIAISNHLSPSPRSAPTRPSPRSAPSRPSPRSAPSRPSPPSAPSRPSPPSAPSRPSPPSTPSRPSPPSAPSRPSPPSAPSGLSPPSAPSHPSPRSAPSHPSPRSAPSRPSPRSAPSRPSPRSAPSRPSPRSAPSRPSPRSAPGRASPRLLTSVRTT